MRVHIGLVSENTPAFLNQVKLCLYSLRKNGGTYAKAPVTLVINGESLSHYDELFLKKHFSPISIVVMPRLGAIEHTSKFNIFYAVDPSKYDILLYLDCDTVILKPLDELFDPILHNGIDFLCRRGGKSDRNRFTDFNALVKKYCPKSATKILHNKKREWPMFNSGVFAATAVAVTRIRKDAVEITYSLFNKWQRMDALEGMVPIRYVYRLGLLKSQNYILEHWPIEQGALALSCIKNNVNIAYLNDKYNSWGNLQDIAILHCFKSAYSFNREKMFGPGAQKIIAEYRKSDLIGKQLFAKTLHSYLEEKYT